MSTRRWAATSAVMGLVAWALAVLGPAPAELRSALGDPQGLVDSTGADALVVVAVGALAWLCWAWGALGLLLTAASTAPGWAGRLSAVLLVGVLPAGARRAAAMAIGVGLSTVGPAVLPAVLAPSTAVAAAGPTSPAVGLDWPAAPPAAPDLDWPAPAPGEHVVVRGDCLWDVAEAWLLRQHPGAPVTDADVARAVHAWWQVNAAVLGPDPDLLLPGQVLRPPG
ncbi:hypothetical protein O2W14_12725 [Modestobacter sp. VKM Ac-2986]|uniref:LysM peptidoglycan-binding domain-containing protein n=1 Tax=Modestobacter sp. VKM Ac-2986 TaxID=3004140 RepID=UPI0022AB6523|nr:hypothetical protein [Modestobacter sp. VKM Ac-2986]MCZ2829699.1 hypothetical protein [Modestobacter sp. VKM Ac-2986]